MIDTMASIDWPEVTKYTCIVFTQERRKEIIKDLYKLLYDTIFFPIVFPFILCTLFSRNYSEPSVKQKKTKTKNKKVYPKGLYSISKICF